MPSPTDFFGMTSGDDLTIAQNGGFENAHICTGRGEHF
jgi:hypothetical protein